MENSLTKKWMKHLICLIILERVLAKKFDQHKSVCELIPSVGLLSNNNPESSVSILKEVM